MTVQRVSFKINCHGLRSFEMTNTVCSSGCRVLRCSRTLLSAKLPYVEARQAILSRRIVPGQRMAHPKLKQLGAIESEILDIDN